MLAWTWLIEIERSYALATEYAVAEAPALALEGVNDESSCDGNERDGI